MYVHFNIDNWVFYQAMGLDLSSLSAACCPVLYSKLYNTYGFSTWVAC